MSAASRGNTPRREYFDSDVIDGMSREEIAANIDAITRSMKSW
jgi:transposase